jgi:hypothetical protein
MTHRGGAVRPRVATDWRRHAARLSAYGADGATSEQLVGTGPPTSGAGAVRVFANRGSHSCRQTHPLLAESTFPNWGTPAHVLPLQLQHDPPYVNVVTNGTGADLVVMPSRPRPLPSSAAPCGRRGRRGWSGRNGNRLSRMLVGAWCASPAQQPGFVRSCERREAKTRPYEPEAEISQVNAFRASMRRQGLGPEPAD